MKFYVIMNNKYGNWGTSAVALQFGLRLNKRGNYSGWLTQEEIDELISTGADIKIVY